MTREKMTEMLCETICVTAEDAEAALEASEWNVIDAAQQLLQQCDRAAKAEAAHAARRDGGWKLGGAVRDLIARITRGRPARQPV